MAIAPTLQKYLDQRVTYEVIPHEPTMSSMRTAQVCHIPGRRLAKGVVLRRNGGYLLAVLPATHHIRLADLSRQLGEEIDLAVEGEIDQLFRDCAHGAVPPLGDCYGIDVVVDNSIEDEPDVYLEGGDHATLIHLSHAQFAKLTAEAPHGRFSVHD
jgi:Ala-tRNA(Pro) deacylase